MEQEEIQKLSLRRQRTAAQLLSGPGPRKVDEIVSHLLAVQAQDLNSARLALRARGTRLTAEDVDRALSVDRSLVVAWLGRGTLHLVHRDDYPGLLALTAPSSATSNRRRLRQESVSSHDADRAVSVIEKALSEEGHLTRSDLGARMAAHKIPTAGQATHHLVMLATLRGATVLGPLKDGIQAFVLAEDWLGTRPRPSAAVDRPAALSRLAQRYLRAHAPAEPTDLAAWVGLPLRDVRVAFDAALDNQEAVDAEPTGSFARLLPSFDPYLLGWKDRGFMVPATHVRRVHPGGGVLRATVVADGKAIGTWSRRRDCERIKIHHDPFAPLSDEVEVALRRDALDVARFEGLTLSR